MGRPKINSTVTFIVGLYREMNAQDRRALMLSLMSETFGESNPINAAAPKPRHKKGGQPPTLIQEVNTTT